MLEIPAEAATLQLLPQGQSLGDIAEIHAGVLSTNGGKGSVPEPKGCFCFKQRKQTYTVGRRTVGGRWRGWWCRGDVRCSLAARWMDAPGAFIVLSLGRHDPRCANSNQLANYEPSRPGPAFRRWLLRLMMAGRPQQLHHLILTATDTLEVEAEKKN